MIKLVILALLLVGIIMLLKRSAGEAPEEGNDELEAQAQKRIEHEAASNELVDAYVNRAKEHALPAIRMKPKKGAPYDAKASRFGGAPWWPEGMALPASKSGDELKLLAQINLEELPENSALPAVGILQFFIATDDLMGLEFETGDLTQDVINKAQNGYRVVYHSDTSGAVADLSAYQPLEKHDCSPLSGEYSIEFEPFQDAANPMDYRWESLCVGLPELDDASDEAVYEALDASGSRIGGYAYFTQTDPRSYNSLGEEWELLLQIDTESDDGVDIMWGDCGVANFFVPKGSLEKMDLSKVWYNWDCC
ncbi:MAG: DUF1963 domain-containing protein [Acidiferrobacterales bacterium]|nr:DUF1963 domain-containing protein [Acidiferrobacterales bacterium]